MFMTLTATELQARDEASYLSILELNPVLYSGIIILEYYTLANLAVEKELCKKLWKEHFDARSKEKDI